METNFESTYSLRQNTIRKARYAKKAALQVSTTRHKNKHERRQTPPDQQKRRRTTLTKTTPASLDAA